MLESDTIWKLTVGYNYSYEAKIPILLHYNLKKRTLDSYWSAIVTEQIILLALPRVFKRNEVHHNYLATGLDRCASHKFV